MRPLVLGACMMLALSGCMGASSVDPATLRLPVSLPPVPGAPLVQDHDHADAHLHLASQGMAPLALASGLDGPAPKGQAYGEVDVKDGFAYVCRGGAQGGFIILDVRDPRHPKPAGQQPGVGCDDVKVNDAGDLVIYGTQRNAPSELLSAPAAPDERLPRGLYLVNVADKAKPFVESFMPVPLNGPHTVHVVNMGGKDIVFTQTYDWVVDAGFATGVNTGLNLPGTPRIEIFEVARGPDGDRLLQPLAVWADPTPPPQGENYYPHDTTVQRHPLTGDWLAYVAYWDRGLVILNVNDPAHPVEVGRFADTAPSKVVNLHQARPFPHLIAGRHVTVLEPELPNGDESGQFTLVDTTDPAHPQRLGYWTLPGHLVVPGDFLFSPHNFNLANGRIYLAHNHGGVWVIDAGDAERLQHPVAVGFFQPHEGQWQGCTMAPRIWSAFYVQGFVYATDSCSGLNVLQFDGDKPFEGRGPMRVMPAAGES
jgi:hypothetical protein